MITMLSDNELERYRRQIMIFGTEGQEKLKSASLLIAGAGGLGSPAAYYLAAAGIGKLIIADSDTVSLSNLNRQILHNTDDIGKEKVRSAEEKLRLLNPDIEIESYAGKMDAASAAKYASCADGIIDAVDNFETRYILNDAALEYNIPLFHGGITGFNGQATTIIPGKTACLRCLFKNAPAGSIFPAIGPNAGIIGMIQANEAVKYISGTGRLLENRLFIWNGEDSTAEILPYQKNPHCISCGRK